VDTVIGDVATGRVAPSALAELAALDEVIMIEPAASSRSSDMDGDMDALRGRHAMKAKHVCRLVGLMAILGAGSALAAPQPPLSPDEGRKIAPLLLVAAEPLFDASASAAPAGAQPPPRSARWRPPRARIEAASRSPISSSRSRPAARSRSPRSASPWMRWSARSPPRARCRSRWSTIWRGGRRSRASSPRAASSR